jgi:HSP20 family molecular chaperone IbpA
MSTLARSTENPLAGFFEWLDLNRPASLSDLTHYIPVETYTEDDTFIVRADLPGVDPEKDIEVTVHGDVLNIHGERYDNDHGNGHSEVRYGSFTRSVRLPKGANASAVSAQYDAGVLVVRVPTNGTGTEPIKVAVVQPERVES